MFRYRVSYKIKYYFRFTVLLFLLLCFGCQSKKNAEPLKGKFENKLVYDTFLNPPSEYRSFPFYSINDSLTVEEIQKQIKEFKQAGFGGYYLHSRLGLITKFLGDDWWKIMEAAVETGNEAGLHTMFYDEDKWPSGFAGGIIPRLSEDYRAKCLARIKKNTVIPEGAEILKSDSLYHYILYTAQFGYDIFNGTCYVDLFNPEMVREFIRVSYKPYVEKYKAEIAGYNFGIFSDEPHVHARYFDKNTPNSGVLSYSPWLEKKFEELYGYKLRDKFELLFEEKDNWREVRMQYYQAKALQFEESFTKQISDFCESNGIKFTGHYLGEDVLVKVRDRIGNSMLHYRDMQQPGMDNLGLTIKGRTITAKRLSSVANQYSIPRRLSELFGISGHNMNFQDRKWLGGWHSILGVNHFCPHLTQYSMIGARKRDYPPTFSYHQPYWKYNKKVEDYLARIAYASTIGEFVPQLLVISPLESEYIKGRNEGEFTSGILTLIEELQKAHFDYDIGDEQIIADTALIKNGQVQIGAMNYAHVLLPDMISIRETTIDLLLELLKNGGLVFNTGRFPEYVDGVLGSQKLQTLKELVIFSENKKIIESLNQRIKPNVVITGNNSDKIWIQSRSVVDGNLIQISNISNTEEIQFSLQSDLLTHDILLWDPSEGKCYNLAQEKSGEYKLSIPASSNIWVTSGSLSSNAKIAGNYSIPAKTKTVLSLENKWQGNRLDLNALTLDFAAYSTDNGKTFSLPEPVIGIFKRLSNNSYSGNLILKYPVSIDQTPENCNLVLEQPEMYDNIYVNNKDVTFTHNEFFIDHKFYSTDITNYLTPGENNIRLELHFIAPVPLSENPKERYGTEIESIYLTGGFAVAGNRVAESMATQRNSTGNFIPRPVYKSDHFYISSEKKLFDGNLTVEGYPFYAGAFELSQNFNFESIDKTKKYFIELPDCESVVSVVELNGQVVDTLCWAPYKTEISELLQEGENELKITLVNSLRNLLGPHHNNKGELIKVGPNSFTGAGGFPDGRGESDWYDLRKTKRQLAIWTDTYNLIPWGFLKPVLLTSSD